MKEIKLTKGKVAIVDDEDYEWLNQWKWQCNIDGYASRHIPINENPKRPTIRMHRLIMNTPDGMDTDHINHDRLDNRRSNLRICTRSQNVANNTKQGKKNLSGRKCVYWNEETNKWRAQVTFMGKTIHLGLFINIEDATKAYNEKAKELWGEFANPILIK